MKMTRGSSVSSVWRGHDPAAQQRWADGFEASMDAGRGHTTAEPGEILCAHDWTSGARAAGLDVNFAQAEGQAACIARRLGGLTLRRPGGPGSSRSWPRRSKCSDAA